MTELGGDFFDLFELGDKKIGVMIADVSGHGIPAALVSFMMLTIFRNNINAGTSTKEVIRLVNETLKGKLPAGKYATMFYGIYDGKNQELTYTSAAHPPGLVIRSQTQEVILLEESGMVVGMFLNKQVNYKEQTFKLIPGDKILLYTDGIIEMTDERDQRLGSEGLEHFIKNHYDLSIDELKDKLYEFCVMYSGEKGFKDDLTILGFEIF